jgi:hypothetical protein
VACPPLGPGPAWCNALGTRPPMAEPLPMADRRLDLAGSVRLWALGVASSYVGHQCWGQSAVGSGQWFSRVPGPAPCFRRSTRSTTHMMCSSGRPLCARWSWPLQQVGVSSCAPSCILHAEAGMTRMHQQLLQCAAGAKQCYCSLSAPCMVWAWSAAADATSSCTCDAPICVVQDMVWSWSS